MKVVPVRVDKKTYEKFKALCNAQGVSMAFIARDMIENFCDDTGVAK